MDHGDNKDSPTYRTTSWEDYNWDYTYNSSYPVNLKREGTAAKCKKKVGAGVKKVKDGASSGFQWIKDKCHKKR